MKASALTRLEQLSRDYPEWKPWLAVIEEVVTETRAPQWQALVPPRAGSQRPRVPLLSGTVPNMKTAHVESWVRRLIHRAAVAGVPKAASASNGDTVDLAGLFEASVYQRVEEFDRLARGLGLDREGLEALASLIPIPFLQACGRLWAPRIAESWTEGYCPICGAWPAFAEIRGIERARYWRCGRCGSGWQGVQLVCPYCNMSDHRELESLRLEEAGSTRAIDACKRCLGYVKSFTVLQGVPSEMVMVEDIASVELDIAALDRNYRRPKGLGYALGATVRDHLERDFDWNRR
ncbi:MAG TPA: formate dehydrogenase accessory protein FdhE [Candidatus Eisenbacteria bacterium]|nr:formate dehydrogenase accessory protein FdhE [Candidatus Eisenbacteria bacterium]